MGAIFARFKPTMARAMGQSKLIQKVTALINNLSLSKQLLLSFLMTSLIPMLLISFLFYQFSKTIIVKEASNRLQGIAQKQAEQIRTYFAERELFLTRLSKLPFFASELKKFDAAFKKGIDTSEYENLYRKLHDFLSVFLDESGLADFFLISPDGNVLFSMQKGEDYGSNLRTGIFKDTDLAIVSDNAAALMDLQSSNFDFYSASNEPAAFMGIPVISQKQTLVGVIVIQLKNEDIYKVVNDYEGLGDTGETVILSEKNEIVEYMTPTRHDPLAAFRRTFPLAEADSFQKKIIRGNQATEIRKDYRGQEALSYGKYFLPSLGWSIIVKMDISELFKPIDMLKLLVAITLICMSVMILIAIFFLTKSLYNPIQTLTEYTRSMSAGNLSLHIPVHSSNEIGILSNEFNTMAERLDDIIKNLESKVQIRTSELFEKNELLSQTLDELRTTQKRMIAQEKLASLGFLTAGIAHEIRNPLNFINNFADLSLDLVPFFETLNEKFKPALTKEESMELVDNLAILKENLHTIHEQGKRTNSIVQRMLSHSRGEEGNATPIDINRLLEEAIKLAFHGFRSIIPSFSVTIHKEFDSKVQKMMVVGEDLSRVFLNLLNNAFYSLNQKISQKGTGYTPMIWVQTKFNDSHFEICLRDNGMGMSEDVQKRIFSPFFTTKPPGEGTGLGLSLSYTIVVESHGGKLSFKSKEGEFTEFIVALPLTLLDNKNEVIDEHTS